MNSLERSQFCDNAISKVKSWFNPQTVDGRLVRSLLLGTLATVVIGELSAYRIIEQDVISGELNVFTIDFVIIGISLLEVFVGPFVSWQGYSNRRFAILIWNVAPAVVAFLWLTMPRFSKIVESEYCHGNNINVHDVTTSRQAAVRLTLAIISCGVFCLTRVATWSHGIAYIEEYAPLRTSMHFGILVAFRVVALIVFHKIIPSGQSIIMQVFAVAGSTIGNIVQVFLFMPKDLPSPEGDLETPWASRDFIASFGRVFRNTLAMTQMVAIGLLAAALWGYAYHDSDIVKVKYHLDVVNEHGLGANLKLILRYLVVIMSVVYIGVKFSPPILSEFCRFRGIKQATVMSILGLIFYILLMTLGDCDKGYVAGLGKNYYTFPECSRPCGCTPRWREFSPVCVVDRVTTFLSPCQAGCSRSDILNNIRVFTNCTCAPNNGRAALGACSLGNCFQAYELHHTLFVMVVMATVLAFQAQGMLVLRAVELHDRSLALGVAGAVVASIAFGCGHLIFLGISAASCRWYEGGRCHLHRHSFPTYIGSASAVMVVLSITISIATWVALKLEERRQKTEDLATPEEQILMD